MEYPKPVMRISELCAMGYQKDYLYRAVHSKWAAKFATKTSRNGDYIIDTAEFEKCKLKGCFL